MLSNEELREMIEKQRGVFAIAPLIPLMENMLDRIIALEGTKPEDAELNAALDQVQEETDF